MAMTNEREVERYVEDILKDLGYKEINYQGSNDKNIQRLLKSKSGGKAGRGKPEFTVKLNGISSDLLIIEIKKDAKYHESKNSYKDVFDEVDVNNLIAKDYAVDGVVHYMASVMKEYNAIGVAVSGSCKDTLKISTFVTKKGKIARLKNQALLSAKDYIKLIHQNDYQPNEAIIIANIQKELPILHNELRDMMKLSEQEKPLLISACLLALQEESFVISYKSKTNKEALSSYTLNTIENTLVHTLQVAKDKADMMMANFSFIRNNPNVIEHLKYILEKVCFLFDEFRFSETSYDVIGNFYNEFLKYTGGDKQGLGIVLTPRHITELFCDLAEINVDSVVLDTCTGTGAFLISAMKNMIDKANGNSAIIERIKKSQLIGIEQNPHMFTLACSNMILRHDGKSNMFHGSCFDVNIQKQVKALKPTVALINPPYSQKDTKESELAFIKQSLDMLQPNGKLVAIVPISCAIEMSSIRIEQRQNILKSHTLDAVFSMPDELFYPVGTVTCIMVFTAHRPHGQLVIDTINNKPVEVVKPTRPTFFGFCKDDGFVKTKTQGRCDKYGKYAGILQRWLDAYRLGIVQNGFTAKEYVNERMEWCCEAYMTIDYASITQDVFEQQILKLMAYELLNKQGVRYG